MEMELAKQVMYILSIPSNFTLDRNSSSSEFMLTFNNLQIWLSSFIIIQIY